MDYNIDGKTIGGVGEFSHAAVFFCHGGDGGQADAGASLMCGEVGVVLLLYNTVKAVYGDDVETALTDLDRQIVILFIRWKGLCPIVLLSTASSWP